DNGDDRRGQKLLMVQENKDIEIKFDQEIKGFYVETDYRFRERNSNPSEIVAWNSYTYDKVGKYDVNGNCIQKATMIEGNKGTIKITNVGDGKYDVIGFRIFAVNLDGTLLDPDGIAFYVGVGDEVATDTYNAVVDLQDGNNVAWVPVTGFLKGVAYSGWTPDGDNPMYDTDGKSTSTKSSLALTVEYYKADKTTQVTTPGTNGNEIAWMKVIMNTPADYIDGATYKQTMKMTKTEGTEFYDQKVITLNVTKKMPETFPSKFGFLAGQPNVDGVFDAYIVPGTAPATDLTTSYALKGQTSGYYALSNVFNIPAATYGTYSFAVKGAAKGGPQNIDGGADITTFDATKGYSFTVESKYIKNNTTYPITANFNYTGISTKWDATARKWKTGKDYPVAYTGNLGITMKCWHSANALAWSTVPSIKWVADPTTTGVINYVDLRTLKVTNSYDNAFFGGTFAKLLDNGWLSDGTATAAPTIVSATLKSGDTEYFTVKVGKYDFNTGKKDSEGNALPADYATCLIFTQKQNTSKPNVHDETLTITTKDAYGHEVTNTITVQVAPVE
ncbi:MAG: hypothetical protein MR717_07490, partial [Prevotella sp.]|nr:hypothetical protein [Prevotella sp.]